MNPDGSTHAPGDAYRQMVRCLAIVREALAGLEVSMRQVVRTRIFVTDISRFAEYAKAHQEVFGDHPPVTSMVEVKALVSPDMLVEVEADAYVE